VILITSAYPIPESRKYSLGRFLFIRIAKKPPNIDPAAIAAVPYMVAEFDHGGVQATQTGPIK
jgi:hypothetical protein